MGAYVLIFLLLLFVLALGNWVAGELKNIYKNLIRLTNACDMHAKVTEDLLNKLNNAKVRIEALEYLQSCKSAEVRGVTNGVSSDT
jgi:ABC-type multidrug transport system fused ATPase/permease subunit